MERLGGRLRPPLIEGEEGVLLLLLLATSTPSIRFETIDEDSC